MSSFTLHPSGLQSTQPDLETEINEIEELLEKRRAELSALQREFREFKSRYAKVVGNRLAELEEVERAIKDAEERVLGVTCAQEEQSKGADESKTVSQTKGVSLKKLFWSVAKMFHPDHAADHEEARRRHKVMAEASRAYREGDFDSLQSLLGDDELRLYCASRPRGEESLAERLWSLKDELRTLEFGIKRIRQDSLFRLKQSVDEQAKKGRDALRETAESINRQIVKARRRLEHLS